MKYFVYILHSKNHNRFYTGITKNITNRLNEHNSKRVVSTKAYVPWEIVHTEEFSSRKEAREKEKFYKSGVGREFRKNYIK